MGNGNIALGGFPAMKRISAKEAAEYKPPNYSTQKEYERCLDSGGLGTFTWTCAECGFKLDGRLKEWTGRWVCRDCLSKKR